MIKQMINQYDQTNDKALWSSKWYINMINQMIKQYDQITSNN